MSIGGDEFVKYMHNLPSYLEKGENFRDKVLNVGVFDWGQLQKWNNNHKPALYNTSARCSSASNASSFFSTDASVNSSREQSVSPSHHRIYQLALQQTHFCRHFHGSPEKIIILPSSNSEQLCASPITDCEKKLTEQCQRIDLDSSYNSCSYEANKNVNEKTLESMIDTNLTAGKSSEKSSKALSEKVRNFSISMGKVGRKSVCMQHEVIKTDRNNPSAPLDTSSRTRSRYSSPLRKLLDPLVKSNAVNSSGRASKSPDKTKSLKSKLGWRHCTTVEINNLSQYEKPRSSVVRALLKVVLRNSLPLFTFAVDSDCDILAATGMRLTASRKDDYVCTYTFFTIQDSKRKNGGWTSQGDKVKSHDFIPNVVAQMKVSDSPLSKSVSLDHVCEYREREYVMSNMNQGQEEEQINDELAAIVIKLPMEAPTENGCNESISENENIFSATVILPSGIHSVPTKGKPSSLIERWRSGGSCGCEGWDIGCKLRVLANDNCRFNTSNSRISINQFDIFNQGDRLQEVFTLAPFEDGIYAVEFNVSLSFLQAFAVCISVLDGGKLIDLSEQSLAEERPLKDNGKISDVSDNVIQGNIFPTYVSKPPLSPVGRV